VGQLLLHSGHHLTVFKMLDQLPPELINRIARAITPEQEQAIRKQDESPPDSEYRFKFLTTGPKSLASLSVVCRRLREIVVPILFERMLFSTISRSRLMVYLCIDAEDMTAALKTLKQYGDMAVHVR
jgi:hypothetical protein